MDNKEKTALAASRPSVLWRPLQRLRAKLGLVPDVEVEVVAQLLMGLRLQIAAFNQTANENFVGIEQFIKTTNENTVKFVDRINDLGARLKVLEGMAGKAKRGGEEYIG